MNKFKAICIILISSFIGIISNPEMPMASDSVAVTGLNPSGIVKTVLLPKTEVKESESVATADQVDISESEISATSNAYDFTYITNVPTYTYVAPEPALPANYIEFNGNVIELNYTDRTDSDAGWAKSGWYYKSGKFIYAHNLDYVFAGLYNLGAGSTFNVSYGGATRTYTVANVVIFDKVDDYSLRGPNGKDITMYPVINGYYDGVGYNMAVMTCYGPNSSQRYVLYAY